jgi:SSS family solute:Na+ symporter
MTIGTVDAVIVVVYLLGIIIVGLLAARRQAATSAGYFLAGRSLRWPMIGMALFATNISTVHLLGLAADGYRVGLVVGNFEWMATFFLILLGLVFAPFYFKNRISTLPEYLERRFSRGSRMFLAFMAVVGALFIHIGMSLFAGSAILNQFFGIDILLSIVLISGATLLYTATGGLKAVVVTESIQTVLLLVGAVCVTVFGVLALQEQGINSLAAFQEAAKPNQLSMIRTEGPFPWYAMVLGYPVLAIWYWCADQTIVQRVLGAQSQRDAQLGPLFAGFIKTLPVFVMVLPGVIAYVLFQDQIGKDANQALPVLIDQLIPVGLKGLIAAALLAALMSTIAGALNSTATLVGIDLIKNLKPNVADRSLVTIGRVTTCVVMVLAMAWSTQAGRFESVFEGGNMMISCLAPPISVVFIWGIFWRRGTWQASLGTLIVGFVLGAATFILDFPVFGETKIITDIWGIPFMLQAWWLFVICSCIFVGISFITPPPDSKRTAELCWKSPWAVITNGKLTGWSDPRALAGILLLVMVILYTIFK